jgi:hypothetical protein
LKPAIHEQAFAELTPAGTLPLPLFRNETRQLLFEVRRHVCRNQGRLLFISHVENMADAMEFRDQI